MALQNLLHEWRCREQYGIRLDRVGLFLLQGGGEVGHLVKGSVRLGEHIPHVELLGVGVRHQDVGVLRDLPDFVDLLRGHAVSLLTCRRSR